jgi:hypothetical protein
VKERQWAKTKTRRKGDNGETGERERKRNREGSRGEETD